ncbi:MAG: YdeI/OmpD-associated family protein [Cyanobacteria bacterium J06621_8]
MPTSNAHEHLEKVEVKSQEELREWFEKNYAQQESIWIVTYKKVVPDKYLANTHIVDECVCFGWMNGRRRKLDEKRTMQLLSPKKARHWAKSYKERYERLKKEGRIHPCTEKQVEADKKSGAWDFMNDVDNLIMPDDLKNALEAHPQALNNYKEFPDSAKRDILRWIKLAKSDETRQKRIEQAAVKAAKNERASGTGAA